MIAQLWLIGLYFIYQDIAPMLERYGLPILIAALALGAWMIRREGRAEEDLGDH